MSQPAEEIGFKSIEVLKEELGTGTYGSVYRARCDDLLCAAKTIHQGLVYESRTKTPTRGGNHRIPIRRFEAEFVFLQELRHPNIIQYLGMYRDPQTKLPVILMELMDESLTDYLQNSTKSVPYHTQVNLCYDITRALSYLHVNEIVHRDLSSNNILLSGKPCRAKLSDFGMAKFLNARMSRISFNNMPGTEVYMPPESYDYRAGFNGGGDVFSFGVVVVQILTRQFPNPGPQAKEIPMPNDPRFPTGKARVFVPEVERRNNHISIVEPSNPLLPIALSCLQDSSVKRPSASDLCKSLAPLIDAPEYTESKSAEESPVHESVSTLDYAKSPSHFDRNTNLQIAQLQRSLSEKDRIIAQQKEALEATKLSLQAKERGFEQLVAEIKQLKQSKQSQEGKVKELRKKFEGRMQQEDTIIPQQHKQINELMPDMSFQVCVSESEPKQNDEHQVSPQLRQKSQEHGKQTASLPNDNRTPQNDLQAQSEGQDGDPSSLSAPRDNELNDKQDLKAQPDSQDGDPSSLSVPRDNELDEKHQGPSKLSGTSTEAQKPIPLQSEETVEHIGATNGTGQSINNEQEAITRMEVDTSNADTCQVGTDTTKEVEHQADTSKPAEKQHDKSRERTYVTSKEKQGIFRVFSKKAKDKKKSKRSSTLKASASFPNISQIQHSSIAKTSKTTGAGKADMARRQDSSKAEEIQRPAEETRQQTSNDNESDEKHGELSKLTAANRQVKEQVDSSKVNGSEDGGLKQNKPGQEGDHNNAVEHMKPAEYPPKPATPTHSRDSKQARKGTPEAQRRNRFRSEEDYGATSATRKHKQEAITTMEVATVNSKVSGSEQRGLKQNKPEQEDPHNSKVEQLQVPSEHLPQPAISTQTQLQDHSQQAKKETTEVEKHNPFQSEQSKQPYRTSPTNGKSMKRKQETITRMEAATTNATSMIAGTHQMGAEPAKELEHQAVTLDGVEKRHDEVVSDFEKRKDDASKLKTASSGGLFKLFSKKEKKKPKRSSTLKASASFPSIGQLQYSSTTKTHKNKETTGTGSMGRNGGLKMKNIRYSADWTRQLTLTPFPDDYGQKSAGVAVSPKAAKRQKSPQMYNKREQVAFKEMEKSSGRALRTLNDTYRVGVATAEELETQGDALNRAESHLDRMEVELDKQAQKVREIEKPFGRFSKKKKKAKETSKPKSPEKPSTPKPSRVDPSTHATSTLSTSPLHQYPSTGSAVVDMNLEEMSRQLEGLKAVGERIGEQLDYTGAQLIRVNEKRERTGGAFETLKKDIARQI